MTKLFLVLPVMSNQVVPTTQVTELFLFMDLLLLHGLYTFIFDGPIYDIIELCGLNLLLKSVVLICD